MADDTIVLKSDLAVKGGDIFLEPQQKGPMPGSVFDMGSWMKDQNMNLLGTDPKGNIMVEDLDGKVGVLDTDRVLRDQRLDPKNIKIQYNDPSTALDDSPVSLPERMKLALGNTKGQLNYLRGKFEDVALDKDKGLTVKDKGVWRAVDKSSLDPWELTADVMEGAIGLAPGMVGGTLGAIGGAAVAGPAGSAIGAGVGAGAVEAIRGTLGRAVGTYDATPQEEMRDIGYEALLNMGGQTLALGAKPVLKGLGSAFQKFKDSASEPVKNLVAETLGRTTGAGSQALRTAMDAPEEVMSVLAKAKGAGDDVVGHITEQQVVLAESILSEAPKKLTAEYGRLKASLVKSASGMGSTDIGALATSALDHFEDAGMISKVVGKGDKISYNLIDEATLVSRNNEGKAAELLSKPARDAMQPLIDSVNTFTKLKSKSGSEAAAALMDLKKNINSIVSDLYPSATASLQRALSQTREIFDTGISGLFNAHGLGEEYAATGALYGRYADAVNMARTLSKDVSGGQKFINRLAGGIKANFTYQDLTKDLSDLLGQSGSDRIRQIGIMESAKGLSSYIPKSGLATQVALGASMAAPALSPGAALMSPKLMLNTIGAGKKSLAFLRNLSPLQRSQLLADPHSMDAFIRTVSTMPLKGQQITDALVQKATGGRK